MANLDLAFIQLFWDLMNRKTGELGRVDFTPQKPAFDLYGAYEQPFPRSTPEEQGVPSDHLTGLITDLQTSLHCNVHELMVLRHGHVIYEGGFDPYHAGIWHVTYSMCKSFTGMAIGLLVDDGVLSLEDKVVNILIPADLTRPSTLLQRMNYADLTIRHLLTMSSGCSFNEVGAISGNEWVKGYFDTLPKFLPGERFEYNSMNSYILSAIVTKLTGKTMFEFLQERLFTPMGITKVFWENSPEGYTKAGWGLFILPEDAAKLGQLYLNHGMWNGEQLISREWVEQSTHHQITTDKELTPVYGFHVWIGNLPDSFMYNGMLGQNVYVYPSLDMIVVVNAGNDEVFAGGTMTKVIRSYFDETFQPSDTPLPADPKALNRLKAVQREAEHTGRPMQPILHGGWGGRRVPSKSTGQVSEQALIHELDGRVYEMHSKGIGIFPLVMQVVHNNYTHGIRGIRFREKNRVLYLDFLEGNTINTFPIGSYKGRHSAVNINGEEYLVGCKGRFGRNEDGELVITLQIAFIEEATERELKIVFKSMDEIELHWSEHPGDVIIADTLSQITTGTGNVNPIVDRILSQVSPGLIKDAMKSGIKPEVHAHLVQKSLEDLIETEESTEN